MRGRRSFFGGRAAVLAVLAALALPCLLFAGGNKEQKEQQPQVDNNGLVVGSDPVVVEGEDHSYVAQDFIAGSDVDPLFKSPKTTVMDAITNTIVTVLDESTYGFIMGLAPFPKVAGDFMFKDENSALKAMRDIGSPFVMGNMEEYKVEGDSEAAEMLPYVIGQAKTRTKRTQERVFGLVTRLFAGLFTAEIVFSAVYGYIQGKDSSVLKELLAKAVMAFLLFLLVAALPFLVEAFKAGFMVMAKTLSGAYDEQEYGSAFQKQWDKLAGCSIYQLPGFVIRCYGEICKTMDPSSMGADNVNLLRNDKDSSYGKKFLVGLLVNLLFLVLKVVGFVLTLFAALHVMLNICECYLLMGVVMLLVPFSVFTPTKFLGGKAVYSLFGNVLELFVLMVVIYAAVPLAMTMSDLVTSQIVQLSTGAQLNVTWPKANVYATAFFLEGDKSKVDDTCRKILADTFTHFNEKLDSVKANGEYGLDSHEGDKWDPDEFSAVVGDKAKLWNLVVDLERTLKEKAWRSEDVALRLTLHCYKNDKGVDRVDLTTADTSAWYPSGKGGATAEVVLKGLLDNLDKFVADNFTNGQLKLETFMKIQATLNEKDRSSGAPKFVQLPYDDQKEVLDKWLAGWKLGEGTKDLLSDVSRDKEKDDNAYGKVSTTYFAEALHATDNNLLMFSIFVSILSIFMLTYFINQSSQITNALLSGNVSSEGFSAAMGRMVAAKAGGAVAGAAGGLTKSMAGGIRNTAASHAVNRMAQGRSAGVSRFVAGSAAMRGAMQTYEFNQKMANLHSASRGASVEHPGQG